MWNIFEHPWTLLVCALALQFVLFVIHIVLPKSRKWWHSLPVIAVVIAAFAVSYFVKTDREQVQELLKTAVMATQEENVQLIDSLIAPDYTDSGHRTKAEFISTCNKWLSRPIIESNDEKGMDLQMSGQTARAILTVNTHIDKSSEIYGTLPIALTQSRIECKKIGKRWLISRVELEKLNLQDFSWNRL